MRCLLVVAGAEAVDKDEGFIDSHLIERAAGGKEIEGV
jgi:hypothetical protein